MSKFERDKMIIVALIIILFSIITVSIFIGRYTLNIDEIISIFQGKISGNKEIGNSNILFDIRIPRIVMSALIGCGLSIVGATLQGVLMNPMASPDVLGTSSAAGFGSALGILLFPNSFYRICILSFIFGIVSIFLVFGICKLKKEQSIISIILSGMIVSSLFMSLISIMKYVADTENTLPAITFWLMGSFSSISKDQTIFSIPILLICIGIIYKLRWKINILSLGDEEAYLLGVKPKQLRGILLTLSAIIISISVSTAGVVGWVGLVIPHLVRTLIGENHGGLVPISALTGGIFLLLMDNIARSLFVAEIPIGILTSLIGAPLFGLLFILGGKDD